MRDDLQLWRNLNQTNLPTSSEVYEEATVSVQTLRWNMRFMDKKNNNKNSQVIITCGQNCVAFRFISF